jgi:alcohol dehydrogenase class IV
VLSEVLDMCASERALLITGPSRRFSDRFRSSFGSRDVEVFDEAEVHVPSAVVARARAVMRGLGADTIVTLGGGATTGLGKALLLEDGASFVAIPTTYSGSERTSVYGVTTGAEKRTGRDARVRPTVVIYDHTLTLDIPPKLTAQSLLNALAHPISALGAGQLDASLKRRALEAVALISDCAPRLVADPRSADARRSALEAASLAAEVIEGGALGVHHQLAHFLGGRFALPHAALHSMLLPQTTHDLGRSESSIYAAIADAAGDPELPTSLFDLLERAGAETSLRALGVERDALEEALAGRPELPAETVWRVFEGVRPG